MSQSQSTASCTAAIPQVRILFSRKVHCWRGHVAAPLELRERVMRRLWREGWPNSQAEATVNLGLASKSGRSAVMPSRAIILQLQLETALLVRVAPAPALPAARATATTRGKRERHPGEDTSEGRWLNCGGRCNRRIPIGDHGRGGRASVGVALSRRVRDHLECRANHSFP